MSEPQRSNDGSGEPIRIGISTCLLGQKVRFDGGHKHDRYLTGTLGQYFEWVPVCPEVEVGLPIPRPTLRLEMHDGQLRLFMPKEARDLTRPMRAYAKTRVKELEDENLSGYLLKKASPSCGMERVRVYQGEGRPPNRNGRGLFAEALLDRFPNLPVEEEGRLHDPPLRENWVTRVFAYHRLGELWSQRWGIGDLVRFHTAHKFLLLAHSPKDYRELGLSCGQSEEFNPHRVADDVREPVYVGPVEESHPCKEHQRPTAHSWILQEGSGQRVASGTVGPCSRLPTWTGSVGGSADLDSPLRTAAGRSLSSRSGLLEPPSERTGTAKPRVMVEDPVRRAGLKTFTMALALCGLQRAAFRCS